VKAVAKRHGAKGDSVFDLPRVLRAPGTFNCKAMTNGHGGIPVHTYADTGSPLTLAEVDARLSAVGVFEAPDDREDYADRKTISPPEDWEFADETCKYVAVMIDGWADDAESFEEGKGRHPSALSQFVRLHSAQDGVVLDFRGGDTGTLQLFGQPARDRTPQQIAEDLIKDSYPDATTDYEIPRALVGYQPGYGVVVDDYPRTPPAPTRGCECCSWSRSRTTLPWSPPPSAPTTNSARTSAAITHLGPTSNSRWIWPSTSTASGGVAIPNVDSVQQRCAAIAAG
jgi:hypothetical protein